LPTSRRNSAEAGEISVHFKNMNVTFESGNAIVVFEQDYNAGSYSDRGIKILTLTKEDGSWKIVSEYWKPLEIK